MLWFVLMERPLDNLSADQSRLDGRKDRSVPTLQKNLGVLIRTPSILF
ncbi:hypothetical protein [Echinicola strongylocentroti]|nr:hypothetical protein [Echinicola strongylocentroti]